MAIFVSDVAEDYADAAAREVKMFVGGPPGSGKTLFGSTWPNPVYLDLEGRLLSIRHKKGIKRVRCSSIQDVEEVKNMLDQDEGVRTKTFGGPVNTVVIDTVDELARLAQRDRLRSEKRETFTMQDWGWYGDYLRGLCRAFRNLDGLNCLFLCHLKASEDGETGKIMYRPDISGSVGNEIASYVDEALLLVQRLTVDPASGDHLSVRVLQSYPDPSHDWVKDHSGVLPGEMLLNFEDDGQQILKMIFGDVPAETRPGLIVSSTEDIDVEEPVVEETQAAEPDVSPSVDTEEAPKKRAAKRAAKTAEPEPAAEPAAETEDVPAKGTGADDAQVPHCAKCGALVRDSNVAEISEIRFGEVLCRADFAEARKAEQSLAK